MGMTGFLKRVRVSCVVRYRKLLTLIAEKEFIIGKLDKIRDMLLQKGGMRFTELQLSDLPLTATAS